MTLPKRLKGIMQDCTLCPHKCRVDRTIAKKGFCGAGDIPIISSAMVHHGEEPPISGTKGSGTIFFSGCNMRCVYCQNYQISQEFSGKSYDKYALSSIMLSLQERGCHNINFVSPTIWIKDIVEALQIARTKGLVIPTVYNTGGYDDPETIKALKGYIDIYMPDMRYSDDRMAKKYSSVKDYVNHNRLSVKEMYRQVGPLEIDSQGIAKKGLMVRLLVLPEDISGIKATLDFLKSETSDDIYLSIMAQYHPTYLAHMYPEIDRRITKGEYRQVTEYAEKIGFSNGWTQDDILLEEDEFIPDFSDKDVFKYYKDKGDKT